MCPCLSRQSLQGCIQCVFHFPVILDDSTIATSAFNNGEQDMTLV